LAIDATNLQKQLPEFVGNGAILSEVFAMDAETLNQAAADRLDTFNQMFVETGTWGLKFWEVFLGIKVDETQTDEVRRRIIEAKIIANSQVFTLKRLVEVLNAYGYGVANVIEDVANYQIEVQVPNVINSVLEVMDLARYLRIVFPAHLAFKLSAINRSMNAITTIDDIGPVLTVRYDSDVYILGIRDNQLYTITKYQVFENEFTKDTVVNIASAYPGYDFDPYNAAAHYSGKVYIPCTSKIPSSKLLETMARNFTISGADIIHDSMIGGKVFASCNDAGATVRTSKRLVLTDKFTGVNRYSSITMRASSQFLFEQPSTPWNGDVNTGPTNGYELETFAANPTLVTLTYRYYDKDGNALTAATTPTFQSVAGGNAWDEKFVLSNFPSNAHSVEFAVTVQKPARTNVTYNSTTYRHVLSWVDIWLDTDVENKIVLESKSYYPSYIAEISMSTGVAIFHNLHTLLGIPLTSRYYMLSENFTDLEVKLHVDEANNFLYAICGYGLGMEATGVYGEAANNLCVAKIDKATMTVAGKNTITSGSLYNPNEDIMVDAGSYPAYADGAINDYAAGNENRVANVYRRTSYIDEDYGRNFYLISGISGDYLVSYARKVKHYTYSYYWAMPSDPANLPKRYLGSCVRLPSDYTKTTKYPAIKIMDLNNLQVREITNEDLLELGRTSVCTRDMTRAPFGSECTKISESKAYGLPLQFIACRPAVVNKPSLNGSGDDSDYGLPLAPFSQTGLFETQRNGSKFAMAAVDKETLAVNASFSYVYNNFQTVNFDPAKDKVPVYPTNIMPDLAMWLETSFNMSLEGNPAITSATVPETPVLYTQYPAGYVGSLFYPYKKSGMVYSEPWDGSIITSVALYETNGGAQIKRYIDYSGYFMNHASRDEYGLGNAVYATYDNTVLTTAYNGHTVANADTHMGKKLARFVKTPYNSYMLFNYV